jgi:hypothetical protein
MHPVDGARERCGRAHLVACWGLRCRTAVERFPTRRASCDRPRFSGVAALRACGARLTRDRHVRLAHAHLHWRTNVPSNGRAFDARRDGTSRARAVEDLPTLQTRGDHVDGQFQRPHWLGNRRSGEHWFFRGIAVNALRFSRAAEALIAIGSVAACGSGAGMLNSTGTDAASDRHGCAAGEVYCGGCTGGAFCSQGCPDFACPVANEAGAAEAAADAGSANDAASVHDANRADTGLCPAEKPDYCRDCNGGGFCVAGACGGTTCPVQDAGFDASNSDATPEGGVVCGPSTCPQGQVCVSTTQSSGQCPPDAGSCVSGPSFACRPMPVACDAGVSCSCAVPSLCGYACQCSGGAFELQCNCSFP